MRKVWLQVLFYAGILALWQAALSLKLLPEQLVPSPGRVLQALRTGFADRAFLVAITVSLKRILFGYSLSILGGLGLGFLLAHSKAAEETLGSLVLGLHTLPSICWMPLGLLWFGLSESAILLVIVFGSLFSLTLATESGLKNVSPIYVHAARTMGSRGWRLYKDVVFPAALPSIVLGLKQGWSFAWRALMAGEIFFVSTGLGHLLQEGRQHNDAAQVFAVMVVIVLIGLAVDYGVFGALERRIRLRSGLQQRK